MGEDFHRFQGARIPPGLALDDRFIHRERFQVVCGKREETPPQLAPLGSVGFGNLEYWKLVPCVRGPFTGPEIVDLLRFRLSPLAAGGEMKRGHSRRVVGSAVRRRNGIERDEEFLREGTREIEGPLVGSLGLP